MATALRYRLAATSYDRISGERVYRVGRRLGIDALGLRPGDVVLDVGCGTGLNFPLLQGAVGPGGRIVGVDSSPAMLRRAALRCRRAGWQNVHLLLADATSLRPQDVLDRAGRACDAVLATYTLSLMRSWRAAWRTMGDVAGPDARIAVVDLQRPVHQPLPLVWLAEVACWLGGADPEARPWTAVEAECADVFTAQAWGGHVQVRAGRRAASTGSD